MSFAGIRTTEHHYFDAADGLEGRSSLHQHILTTLSVHGGAAVPSSGRSSADSRDGTPNGFHILSVDGLNYTTRFIPAKEPNGRQNALSIHSRFHGISKDADRDFSSGEAAGFARSARRASRFDPHRQRDRRRREDEGQHGHRRSRPIEMARSARPDPFVQEVFARNEATKRRGWSADNSSHIWTARLPVDLALGTYAVLVEAMENTASRSAGGWRSR